MKTLKAILLWGMLLCIPFVAVAADDDDREHSSNNDGRLAQRAQSLPNLPMAAEDDSDQPRDNNMPIPSQSHEITIIPERNICHEKSADFDEGIIEQVNRSPARGPIVDNEGNYIRRNRNLPPTLPYNIFAAPKTDVDANETDDVDEGKELMKLYEDIQRDNPNTSPIRCFNLAQIMQRMHDIILYNRLLKLDPKKAEALYISRRLNTGSENLFQIELSLIQQQIIQNSPEKSYEESERLARSKQMRYVVFEYNRLRVESPEAAEAWAILRDLNSDDDDDSGESGSEDSIDDQQDEHTIDSHVLTDFNHDDSDSEAEVTEDNIIRGCSRLERINSTIF